MKRLSFFKSLAIALTITEVMVCFNGTAMAADCDCKKGFEINTKERVNKRLATEYHYLDRQEIAQILDDLCVSEQRSITIEPSNAKDMVKIYIADARDKKSVKKCIYDDRGEETVTQYTIKVVIITLIVALTVGFLIFLIVNIVNEYY